MSRIQVGHRALMACLAVTLLVVLPTHAQWTAPYVPMSPGPLPDFEPPPQCCVPSAITPPSMTGCNNPCQGHVDCSGNVSNANYDSAQCIEPPTGGGWCARSAESVHVPAYICMEMECTINGEPGEECRWIYLFGGGYDGIGFKCASGAAMCN